MDRLLEANVTGLSSSSNITVFLAVEQSQGVLDDNVVSLSGILLLDTSPPVYEAIELLGGAVDDVRGTFEFSMQVTLNEPGAVYWAVYRDYSCITGNRSLEELRAGSTLPSSECDCNGIRPRRPDVNDPDVPRRLSGLKFRSLRLVVRLISPQGTRMTVLLWISGSLWWRISIPSTIPLL